MVNEFSAVYEQDGEWFIGYCPEIPEANGQGKTLDECRKSLAETIKLILETHREDILNLDYSHCMSFRRSFYD